MDNHLRRNRTDILFSLIIVFSVLILVFFVCPFSPHYRYCYETDSICYRIMGKGVLEGRVPYRDLFDHKGPVTYLVYALGLLIGGGSSYGIWIVFSLINALSFFFLYKVARLYFNERNAFYGVGLTMLFLFFYKNCLFDSATKPDHIVLCFLILSEYIFLKRIKERGATSPANVFSACDMLLLGLLCGGVFFLKMNYCIYYLAFIGFYFLYQLIHKQFKAFLISVLPFIGGIVLTCLPFLVYLGYHGALKDFVDAYITFNAKYAEGSGLCLFIFRSTLERNIIFLVIIQIILAGIAFYLSIQDKEKNSPARKQTVVYALLTTLILAFITLPPVFNHILTVLTPLLFIGPCYLVNYVRNLQRKDTIRIMSSCISIIFVLCFILIFLSDIQGTQGAKTSVEEKVEQYLEYYPDSTYLYFDTPCCSYLPEKTDNLPSFKYFYVPPYGGADIATEQANLVRANIPDILVFLGPEEPNIEEMEDQFLPCGYSLFGYEYSVYYYVRTEDLIAFEHSQS